MVPSLPTLAALANLLFSVATSTPLLAKRGNLSPVILSDFPDPQIVCVNGTWYAFGSQSIWDQTHVKVQLATSPDFKEWTVSEGEDMLGELPPWVHANNPTVWAPSVSKLDDGRWLMYYSAVTNTAGNGQFHCVGTAISDTIDGPYNSNNDEPFACPTNRGGAIDASSFRDTDGTLYALYKIDHNALGNGGNCNNGIQPILSTPIMIQKVGKDGTTKIGGPIELIDNSVIDGPLVEAPYMIRNKDGTYVLFFSSNCYLSDLYDVSYATSKSPTGPFVKAKLPLFVTGVQGLIGPGGASVAADGKHFAMHGYAARSHVGRRRSMFVTEISSIDNGVVAAD